MLVSRSVCTCVLTALFFSLAYTTVSQAQHLRVRAGGGAAIHLQRTSQEVSPFRQPEEYPSIINFYENPALRLDLDAAYLVPLSSDDQRIAVGGAFQRQRLQADDSVENAAEALGERLILTQGTVYVAYEKGPVAGPMFYGMAGLGARSYSGTTTFNRGTVDADYEYKPGFAAQVGVGGDIPLGTNGRWSLGARLVMEYSTARRDVITFTADDGSTETASPTGDTSLDDPSLSLVVLLGYRLPL